MKLRWSDGYSYAVEFEADPLNFVTVTVEKYKEFFAAVSEKINEDEKIFIREAHLHTNHNGKWLGLKTDGALAIFAKSIENTKEAIESHFSALETEMLFKREMIINQIHQTHSSAASLENFILDTVKMIDDATSEEE